MNAISSHKKELKDANKHLTNDEKGLLKVKEEIAALQKCQLGTIKSRLSRGRELLLKRLKYYGITLDE